MAEDVVCNNINMKIY